MIQEITSGEAMSSQYKKSNLHGHIYIYYSLLGVVVLSAFVVIGGMYLVMNAESVVDHLFFALKQSPPQYIETVEHMRITGVVLALIGALAVTTNLVYLTMRSVRAS